MMSSGAGVTRILASARSRLATPASGFAFKVWSLYQMLFYDD